MARVSPATTLDLGLKDDEVYQGLLDSVEFKPTKKEGYPDQLLVKWELRQGIVLWDYVGISVGQRRDGTVSKLRQMLNALGEKPKQTELWFDPEKMEWGYDLDGDDSTPAYARLTRGMLVMFKGENRKGNDGQMRYRVTGYKAPTAKARTSPLGRTGLQREQESNPPVDVDPDEIPF